MATVPGVRSLAIAQRGFRRDVVKEFVKLGAQIRGILSAYAGADGKISAQNETRVLRLCGELVERMFVGMDGRSAFADDGVTALAPFSLLLNKWYVYTVYSVVKGHHRWMKQSVPADVFDWLAKSPAPRRAAEAEKVERSPFLRRDNESEDAYRKRLKSLRIFEPNPLAEYDPMHTWVDPNGYRLSDRIWKVSKRTRERIDDLVAARIRDGKSALSIAKEVERFLNPERALLRTDKPAGRDASFDAMRLARTEISRAHAQASFIAAKNNPYCKGVEWALSASHPRTDVCDSLATIGKNGGRLKPAYTFDNAKIPPAHPFCLCHTRPAMEELKVVTSALRDVIRSQREGLLSMPNITPAQVDRFTAELIGNQLVPLIQQIASLVA